MNYQINEGSFALPPQAQDRSVQMLVLNFGPGGLTLVVTRDLAEEGEALDALLLRQLRTLGSQVKQLKHSAPLALQVGPARLPAFQVSTTFRQNNASVHQLQTMVALRDKAVLVFTLTCAAPLTPEQDAYARQVLDSFTPATPD
jgi:hypothetical protein